MAWLRKLDDFLIDAIFQKVSNWSQLTFGVDSLRLARFLLVGELLTVLLLEITLNVSEHFGYYPRKILLWLSAASWPILAILAIRGMGRFGRAMLLKEMIAGLQEQKAANPFRVTLLGARIVCIAFSLTAAGIALTIPDPLSFCLAANFWVGTVAEYFLACNPLPPQKSKVRAWLESWNKFRILQPVAEH